MRIKYGFAFGFGSAPQRFALPACGRAWTMLGSQEKLEARKMLENAADSHTSGARFVRRLYERKTPCLKKRLHRQLDLILHTI
jgi:hypothetical protein